MAGGVNISPGAAKCAIIRNTISYTMHALAMHALDFDAPTLGFDCSTGPMSVALWRDGRMLAHRRIDTPSKQAALLVPTIDEVLEETGLHYRDLRALVTTLGPGSFTSIRVGLATARGIAFAAHVPLFTTTSLALLAAQCAATHPVFDTSAAPAMLVPCLAAGRGQYYTQAFHLMADGTLHPTQEATLTECEALRRAAQTTAVNGAQTRHFFGRAESEDSAFISPATVDIAAALTLAKRAPSLLCHTPEATPLYIRAPDAKHPTLRPLAS